MATSLSKLLLLLASNLRILKTQSISVSILIYVPSQPKKDLKLKDQGKVAFIPYITAGDPDLSTTAQALKMLDSCGSNVIELGVMLDSCGSNVIELGFSYSFSRSFARGTNFNAIMSMLKEVVPQLLVPLFYFRTSTRFLSMVLTSSCMDVGVHGLVVPEAPFEATKSLRNEVVKNKIDLTVRDPFSYNFRCVITTPTTPTNRMKDIVEASEGFVYLVSSIGVTGACESVNEQVPNLLRKLESVIVKVFAEAKSPKEGLEELETFIKSFKSALL
ncbi:unnamed protein product [Malus baccata var. baccata]